MTKAVLIKACPACGMTYRKAWRHQTYCSLECAIYSRIDKRGPDECWPWTGGGNDRGYGQVSWNKERVYVHRFVCTQAHGRKDESSFTLHSCDYPPCCNPAHLSPGTQTENAADMAAKRRGRQPKFRGVEHPGAKLTEDQVREIRAALKGGKTARQLARIYTMSIGAIDGIKRGTNWSHLI